MHKVWKVQFKEQSPAQFEDAIKALKSQVSLNVLDLDLGLTFAAWKHSQYMATVVKTSTSIGADGNKATERANEFGSGMTKIYENTLISRNPKFKAEHLVAEYIISDGLPKRTHRLNMLESTQTKMGVGISYDKTAKEIYHVVMMADKYTCDKCTLITCEQQKACGWTQYLAEGKTHDPCNSKKTPSTTSKVPITPSTPSTSSASTVPTVPKATEAPSSPRTPSSPKAPKTPSSPKAPRTPRTKVDAPTVDRWSPNPFSIKDYLETVNSARTNPKSIAHNIQQYSAIFSNPTVALGKKSNPDFIQPWKPLLEVQIKRLNGLNSVRALVPELGLTYQAWSNAKSFAEQLKGKSSAAPPVLTYMSSLTPNIKEVIVTSISTTPRALEFLIRFILEDKRMESKVTPLVMSEESTHIGIGMFTLDAGDKNPKVHFLSTILVSGYKSDNSQKITCDMQAECGWTQYLKDAGLADPCRK